MKKILLGIPCGGGACMSFETARAIFQASTKYPVQVMCSTGSWDNFNNLWSNALTMGARGDVDVFAMLHTDIEPMVQPEGTWLDLLIGELERLKADLVSVVVPQKDGRGITSSGIGDPADPWEPYRRFTMTEVMSFPETFNQVDANYPDRPLLHNNGMWVADMKCDKWYATEKHASGREHVTAVFDFPRSIQAVQGEFRVRCESEDWYFSRKMWEMGINGYITRKVHLLHCGGTKFPNNQVWGSYHADNDTMKKWAIMGPQVPNAV